MINPHTLRVVLRARLIGILCLVVDLASGNRLTRGIQLCHFPQDPGTAVEVASSGTSELRGLSLFCQRWGKSRGTKVTKKSPSIDYAVLDADSLLIG